MLVVFNLICKGFDYSDVVDKRYFEMSPDHIIKLDIRIEYNKTGY